MIYLAGDNNLDGAAVVDLSEMKTVGSTDQVNIVAELDRAGSKRKTNRYYLRRGTTLAKDVVQVLGETNMGDPKVLEDFVTRASKNYPAERYILVIWNHGAGWDDANLYQGDVFSGATPPVVRGKATVAKASGRARGLKTVHLAQARAGFHRVRRALFAGTVRKAITSRAIAFDDQAQDFLDNVELKRVLTRIKKILKRKLDVLGMDACLMSMAEVAYQVRGAATHLVGSEETEPGDGWPYDRILKALAAKPDMANAEVASAIVTQYLASYRPNDGVTQAATDLGQLAGVANAVDGLGKALTGALGDSAMREKIVSARIQAQEYSAPYDDYCDLTDLCSLLTHHLARTDITKACDAVKAAVDSAVIEDGAKGSSVANSHGMSIYFPKRKVSPLYKTLDFAKKNAWAGFIDAFVTSSTRRPPVA
jgi:hypothetical protein